MSWDLSGWEPRTYTATVTLTVSAVRQPSPILMVERRSSTTYEGTATVTVSECSEPPKVTPQCPSISISCPSSVVAGKPLSCTATITGGVPRSLFGLRPKGSWYFSTNNGNSVPYSVLDKKTNKVEVITTGLDNQQINAIYRMNWHGIDCSSDPKSIDVTAKPTPVPTQTLTPTQTPTPFPPPTPQPTSNTQDSDIVVQVSPTATPLSQSPSPAPSPSLSPSPTPSASPSPSPTALPTISPSASPIGPVPPAPPDSNERFLHALRIFAFIAALAASALFLVLLLLAMKHFGGVAYMKSIVTGFRGVNTPDQKEAAGGGQILGGLIIGGQKRKNDEVHCTAFAPHYAAPGDSFLVQVFAHLASQVSQLAALAQAADTDAAQRDSVELDERVERGQELFFELKIGDLSVQEPTTMRLVWNGKPKSVKFDVRVPTDCPPMTTTGTVDIIYLGVPIGRLRFKLKITPGWELGDAAAKQVAQEQKFFRYSRAFISYASQDRAEVLRRVQMLDELKIEYFQDILSLDPGDRWEQQLYKKIDESDVFFLFWSTAASKSKWVEEEVLYALEHKHGEGGDAPVIKPVIIEGPPPAPPPPRLQAIHFNDKLMYLIWGEDIQRRKRQRDTP